MGYQDEGRTAFEVECAECGETTTVPFEPRGDRPVYCRDCFQKKRPPRGGGGGGGRGGGGRGGGDREMHEVPCTNCGKTARVPFKPTAGRDVLCQDCFRR